MTPSMLESQSAHDLAATLNRQVRWMSSGIESDFLQEFLRLASTRYAWIIYHTDPHDKEYIKDLARRHNFNHQHGRHEFHQFTILYNKTP